MEIKINDFITVMVACNDNTKANDILAAMKEHVDEHGYASIDLLYALFDPNVDYEDMVLGWHNLEKAHIVEYNDSKDKHGRSYLHFPPIEEIDWKEIEENYD